MQLGNEQTQKRWQLFELLGIYKGHIQMDISKQAAGSISSQGKSTAMQLEKADMGATLPAARYL